MGLGPLTEYEADISRLVMREQGGPDQSLKCYYVHHKAGYPHQMFL
jgi:hypothetical protein